MEAHIVLYGAAWVVNMFNVCFWFVVEPTGDDDTIKTTVTWFIYFIPFSISKC